MTCCMYFVIDNPRRRAIIAISMCKASGISAINLFSGSVGNIPYLPISNIDKVVKQNIYISKSDWNSHESSWDFETNPLLTINENTHINKKIEQQNNEIGEIVRNYLMASSRSNIIT